MTNKYIDYYQTSILEHYENVKDGQDSDLLQDPSPGDLKKLCLIILERGLNNSSDLEVFTNFFGKDEKLSLYQIVNGVKTDALRTPSNFLRYGKKITQISHLNILATLVGFEHRPFVVFKKRKEKEDNPTSNEEKVEMNLVERITLKTEDVHPVTNHKEEEIKQEEATTATPQQPEKQNQIQTIAKATNTARPRKIALVSTAVLLFGGMSGFLIHKTTEKQCMVWKKDHYERIDCQQPTIHALMEVEKVQPYNDELFAQEKIIPTDTTTFFKNGKSAVYYLKTDNQYEFFKQPGFHPIHSERKLNRITKRIIRNWKNSKNTAENP